MKKIYEYFVDCGRMGELEGMFIADDAEVERIIGEEVHFGECLGKHSDISVNVERSQFEVVTDNQEDIDAVCRVLKVKHTISGYNPFVYWEEVE